MDLVLGVSITTTAVHLVLVEGDSADGATIDHDALSSMDRATLTSEQLVSTVLGTQAIAAGGGHRLRAIGVTFGRDHRAVAEELRDALHALGVEQVTLATELQAAEALAGTIGRTQGYATTGVISVQPDTATLAVVPSGDGIVVKALTAMLDGDRPAESLAALVNLIRLSAADDTAPDGIYLVSSDVDLTGVAEFLDDEVPLPVTAPAEPELALARGAALAAARRDSDAVAVAHLPDGRPALFVPRAGAARAAKPKADTDQNKRWRTVPVLTAVIAAAGATLIGSASLAVGMSMSSSESGDPAPVEQAMDPVAAPAPLEAAPPADALPPELPPQLPPPQLPPPPVIPAAPPAAPPPLPQPVIDAVNRLQQPITIPVLDQSITVPSVPSLIDRARQAAGP